MENHGGASWRERTEQILRAVVLVLLAVLCLQLVKVAMRINPLSGVKIPELPVLSTEEKATNKVDSVLPKMASATSNAVAKPQTNAAVVKGDGTNLPASTNASVAVMTNATNVSVTNLTNAIIVAAVTNASPVSSNTVVKSDTNSPAPAASTNKPPIAKASAMPAGMPMGMMPPNGKGAAAELPADIKFRVDRIYESEFFGPVMRPLPMALLGIAGESAFLRSSTGQTSLAKEGDTVGDLKLLKIGINRVLVEKDGQKKELMIFEGYGGESLMPKEEDKSK